VIEWIVLGIIAGLIIIWALVRLKAAGIPLALGTALMYTIAAAAILWYPPSIGQLLLLTFLAGVSLTLIAWGISNIITYRLIQKPFYHEKAMGKAGDVELKMTAIKAAGNPYVVFVGAVPWNYQGAGLFSEFLNDVLWQKGYKVTFLSVDGIMFGAGVYAYVWGIAQPKTILDRILY